MANDINKEDPHYKGDYGSIYEVNRKFPTGGVAGDFVVIEGWAHYWNADRGTWCVNAERDSYWDELITNIIEKFKLVRGATYMGVASLDTVPAKAIGAKMYYFATVAGSYKNFDNLVVPQGINVLYSENGSSWVNTTLLEVAQELGVSTNKVVSQKTLNDALAKKFDKESVAQESGEAEDKVMSQKAVSDKLSNLADKLSNHITETTQVGAKWAFENKIPNILMFARLVGNYTDAQIYNKRVHTNNSLTHEFKKIDLSSFNSNCELYLAATEVGTVTLEYFTESDLANYINDVDSREKKDIQDVNGKIENSIDYNHGNYNLMKHITVKKNGSGDFTNIQDAINSVKDASQTNQYDIQIYDDFIVNDLTQLYLKDGSRNTNIIPTALCALVWTKSWVHLRGMGRTVKLAVVSPSQNMDGDAFQYIQTLFVRGNVIIANLEVTIKGGRYAIHQDESANGSNSIDANCITKYRDITAIHYGNNDYTNGNKWSSCYAQANGISDGQTMIFENCKWYSYTQEPFYTHENYNYENSCNMKFKNCAMGTAYNTGNIDRNVYFGDLGSGKLANVTIEGCNFPAFTAYSFKVNRGTEKERVHDDIRLGGVMLHGSSNGKMLVNRRRIYSLCLQTLQNNHNVKVVGGTAYDSIYGENYQTYNGTINAPGLAIGIRLMADMQSWWGADATNVYSLAYRLGNCKETQKTLIVEIDGEQHVIMFDKNYMTEDGSSYDIHTTPKYDFNGIINDVNAAINDYGIAFASNFWYDYKYFEDEESTMYNNTNEAIMPMDMLVRNGDNWKKANSETAKYVEGFAEERINPMNFGRVCLIKNCYIPATSKSIGILLTVDNNAHLVETSDESKAIFKYVNKNVIERF